MKKDYITQHETVGSVGVQVSMYRCVYEHKTVYVYLYHVGIAFVGLSLVHTVHLTVGHTGWREGRGEGGREGGEGGRGGREGEE